MPDFTCTNTATRKHFIFGVTFVAAIFLAGCGGGGGGDDNSNPPPPPPPTEPESATWGTSNWDEAEWQ